MEGVRGVTTLLLWVSWDHGFEGVGSQTLNPKPFGFRIQGGVEGLATSCTSSNP